jgi:hypothetical protein
MITFPEISSKEDLKAAKKDLVVLEKKIYKIAIGKHAKALSELAHVGVQAYDYCQPPRHK